MLQLLWDNILETCYRRNCFAVAIAGSPLLFRHKWGLEAASLPPPTQDDVNRLSRELLSLSGMRMSLGTYDIVNITYGDVATFRGAVPRDSSMLMVAPLGPGAPALGTEACEPQLKSGPISLKGLVTYLAGREVQDCLLAAGCPPLLITEWGFHLLPIGPLDESFIGAEIIRMTRPPVITDERDGYHTFDIHQDASHCFRATFFGYPKPRAGLVQRIPSKQTINAGCETRKQEHGVNS